jgi:hypothetical protein
MEILLLVFLYYLSQNPNFEQSVKPLMEQLKNSEQTLRFLKDLAKFNETFQTNKNSSTPPEQEACHEKKSENKKQSDDPSPTLGIADDFIQSILDGYWNKKK